MAGFFNLDFNYRYKNLNYKSNASSTEFKTNLVRCKTKFLQLLSNKWQVPWPFHDINLKNVKNLFKVHP